MTPEEFLGDIRQRLMYKGFKRIQPGTGIAQPWITDAARLIVDDLCETFEGFTHGTFRLSHVLDLEQILDGDLGWLLHEDEFDWLQNHTIDLKGDDANELWELPKDHEECDNETKCIILEKPRNKIIQNKPRKC